MRILLLNQNHIGDALFTTPAITALRTALPDAHIVNATLPGVAPLFAANPRLNERWLRPSQGFTRQSGFIRRIRRARFDAVIALAANSTLFGILARLSGAGIRIGFDRPAIRRFLTHPVRVRSTEQHHVEDHLDQARVLVPAEGGLPMELFRSPEWDERWRGIRASLSLDSGQPLVGLNPGATVTRKQWAIERWAALSDRLMGEGFQPLLFGGPGDRDLVERIRALSRRPAPSAQGLLDIGTLAAAAADCGVFVSGDTGPLHMAVAVGTPVVALHGPTNPHRTGPYTDRAVVIHHEDRQEDSFGSMESITVEEVVPAVHRALAMACGTSGSK